ncbi:MAG: hypothetical protein M0036_05035 [Desulfobacteraceae bacterium]|nr:hypothetical protein [Desulfobacteraceae bacterium]
MAYFSNSTEGAILDEQCDECLHADPDEACPLAFAQMNFNYAQCGNELAEKILNSLVNKDGKCLMKVAIDKYVKHFIEKDDVGCDHEWSHAGRITVDDAEICINCKAVRGGGR